MKTPDGSETDPLVAAIAEQLAQNAERMDGILKTVQEKLGRDYTHVPAAIGLLMILGGSLHIWIRQEFAFSLTSLIWGAIILCATLFFRSKIAQNHVAFTQALLKLDRERATQARQQTALHSLLIRGIPEGISLQELQILLGEYTPPDVAPRGNGTKKRKPGGDARDKN